MGWRPFDLHACYGVAEWIGSCVVGHGFHDLSRDHIHCHERFTEGGICRINVVHVAYCTDEGRDIDLVQIESKNAVVVSFDAGDNVDAESG